MAFKQSQGAFRVDGPRTQFNLVDLTVSPRPANGSQWTLGATQIDSVGLSPSLMQDWQLLSLSVNALLSFYTSLQPGVFGKLGRIVAGLLPVSRPTPQALTGFGGLTLPCVVPMLALPPDASLTFSLWDPAINPMPPQDTQIGVANAPLGPQLSISGTLNLPVPIAVRAGQQFSIGIWATPSLLGEPAANVTMGLAVRGATYSVDYNDEGFSTKQGPT